MGENKLGNIICKLRKEKGLTQKDLANELNISDKAISRWECGASCPNLEMIFQISKYFNVSFNDLITLRVETENSDDKIVQEIIEEFSEMNNKHQKRIKHILIISMIVILILIIAIIFTNTYNRFKVYKVYFESKEFYPIKGMYVETNIRDTIYLGDVKLRNYDIKDDDTVSVDIYYLQDNKEQIIKNYSNLKNVYLSSSQIYTIKNFSDYIDDMYLRVIIIDSKNEIIEYETKLTFVLDFSNNKVFYEDEYNIENLDYEIINYSNEDIKNILLKNGFEETSSNSLIKNDKPFKINYFPELYLITLNYEKNNFSYRYSYKLNNNILDVLIFDENYIEVENYKYDIPNNKMECTTGSCNDYKAVLKILDENVLNLLRK